MSLIDDVNDILSKIVWAPGETAEDKLELVKKHKTPEAFMRVISRLDMEGLMSDPSCFDDLIHSRCYISLSEAYILLNNNNLFSEKHAPHVRETLKKTRSPTPLAEAFVRLSKAGILSSDLGPMCAEVLTASTTLSETADAFILFHELEKLTKETIGYIKKRNYLKSMVEGIKSLKEAGLLLDDKGKLYFDQIIKIPKTAGFISTKFLLQKLGLWSNNYFEQLSRESYPIDTLVSILTRLSEAGILQGASGSVIWNHLLITRKLYLIDQIVSFLRRNKLLTEFNYQRIITHAEHEKIIGLLNQITSKNLFKDIGGELFLTTLLNHPNLRIVIDGMDGLEAANLFNPRTIELLLTADDANMSCHIILALNKSGLFVESNYVAMMSQLNLGQLANLVLILSKSSLFRGEGAQAGFEAFLNHPNILLDNIVLNTGWERLTTRLLALPGILGHIVAIAEQHQDNPAVGKVAVITYITGQITIEEQAQRVFYDPQTTHTASIHKSVSESAIRLKTRYNSFLLKADYKLARKKEFVTLLSSKKDGSGLYGGNKKSAANRAMLRLSSENEVGFKDTTSQVKTIELFYFVWMAIHDEALRVGTLLDARNRFIDALYEIQRGGNINQAGVDNAADDVPICASGTFNKLMEALVEIHPDVQLVFINQEGAVLKFIIVVIEEAMLYLSSLAESRDDASHEKFRQFTDEIKPEEGLPTELWDLISARVTDRMFDEFGSLYPGGKDSEAFTGLISSGGSVSLKPNNFIKLRKLLDNLSLPALDLQHFDLQDFQDYHGYHETSNNSNGFFYHSTDSLAETNHFVNTSAGDDSASKRRRVDSQGCPPPYK